MITYKNANSDRVFLITTNLLQIRRDGKKILQSGGSEG